MREMHMVCNLEFRTYGIFGGENLAGWMKNSSYNSATAET